MRFGVWEILLIVILVVILFGSAKIPGMMRNVANGINVFKKELKDTNDAKSTSSVKNKSANKAPVAKKTRVAGAKKTLKKK